MTETDTRPALETQRSHAEKQARPNLEKWRQAAEHKAEEKLDADAMAAINETVRAIDAIAAGNAKEALQMIERATGKVDVAIARNPKLARIPVRTEALILDAAPADMGEIRRLADLAEAAVSVEDYPGARSLLDALRSEIRIRTWYLPLVDFPTALRDAAALLDGDREAAGKALLAALRTLIASDRVMPIPLLLAQEPVEHAQMLTAKDKDAAQEELDRARFALNRAKALGYRRQDTEYETLKSQIEILRKQLRGSGDTASSFHKLIQNLTAFVKRQSERSTPSPNQSPSTSKAA
ncbi:MAG: YfdX family protein [Acidobacteriaceae bacterium]